MQKMEWLEAQRIEISIDLFAAAKKHLQFLGVVDQNQWLYDGPLLERAIYRYNAYWLPLLAKYSESSAICEGPLVPPLDCEWVWHCHRLNPVRYKSDCEQFYGRVLDNYGIESFANGSCKLVTENLWKKMYPMEPYDLDFDKTISEPVDISALEKCTTYDLVSAVKRQSSFYYEVSRARVVSDMIMEEAVGRYKAFLYLIKKNLEKSSKQISVPTKDIDIMWHTHQLNPSSYYKDLEKLIGNMILHHDDNTDTDESNGMKLDSVFSGTTAQWEQTFGSKYSKASDKTTTVMAADSDGCSTGVAVERISAMCAAVAVEKTSAMCVAVAVEKISARCTAVAAAEKNVARCAATAAEKNSGRCFAAVATEKNNARCFAVAADSDGCCTRVAVEKISDMCAVVTVEKTSAMCVAVAVEKISARCTAVAAAEKNMAKCAATAAEKNIVKCFTVAAKKNSGRCFAAVAAEKNNARCFAVAVDSDGCSTGVAVEKISAMCAAVAVENTSAMCAAVAVEKISARCAAVAAAEKNMARCTITAAEKNNVRCFVAAAEKNSARCFAAVAEKNNARCFATVAAEKNNARCFGVVGEKNNARCYEVAGEKNSARCFAVMAEKNNARCFAVTVEKNNARCFAVTAEKNNVRCFAVAAEKNGGCGTMMKNNANKNAPNGNVAA